MFSKTLIQIPILGIFLITILCSRSQLVNSQQATNGYPLSPPNSNIPNQNQEFSIKDHKKNYFDIFFNSNPSQSQFPINQAVDIFFKTYNYNLTEISKKCHPKSMFASFNPDHRSAVEDLVNLYDDQKDINGFLEFSKFVKTHPLIHPHLWFASFLKVQNKRFPHHLSLPRPSALELFPSDYFPDTVLNAGSYYSSSAPAFAPAPFIGPEQIQQRVKREFFGPIWPRPRAKQQCLIVDENIGSDNGIENALWYFREDIQLMGHHFIWHLMFPTASNQVIQRRGELFYFVHHDILARYSAERLANGLQPTIPAPLFVNLNTVLAEGYNAHLADSVSSQFWAPRQSSTPLNSNTLNQNMITRLNNLSIFSRRLIGILNTGNINVNGNNLPLSGGDNINVLGNLMEASVFSINPNFYGQPGVHNDGHWVIANLLGNFPQGTLGVMGHSATAMRDIIFYRLHAGIENLFSAYKANFLPPYGLSNGDNPLVFPGIQITSLNVQSVTSGAPLNALSTFWNMRKFTLEGGLDFNARGSSRSLNINVCAKHLDHEEFNYQIQVNNALRTASNVFVRIYMAPRFKSLNPPTRYTHEEQRGLFFAMDSFVQALQPGSNTISRSSIDSTLTAPWTASVNQIRQDIANGATRNVNCECGFPHHLLLPRGTEQGMIFDLFVMLTDASVDLVQDQNANSNPFGSCIPSHIHCGILGQNYPDAKPMGYPFDRTAYTIPIQTVDSYGNVLIQNLPPNNLEAYVGNVPNMASTQVTITFRNVQAGI